MESVSVHGMFPQLAGWNIVDREIELRFFGKPIYEEYEKLAGPVIDRYWTVLWVAMEESA